MPPNEDDAIIENAERLVEDGRHDEALHLLQGVVQRLSCTSARASILRARILFSQSKDKDAVNMLDNLKLSSWVSKESDIVLDVWRTYQLIAETYELEGKYAEAIEVYKKARNILVGTSNEFFTTQLALIYALLHENRMHEVIYETYAVKSTFKYTYPIVGGNTYARIADQLEDKVPALEWYAKALRLYARVNDEDKAKIIGDKMDSVVLKMARFTR